ncbi:extracellular solute-binding protein [Promicromonospora sp. Populi]|uniref:extracellular solute-binding protein n=1 Tax=Promicromonospora sp. Populi TaxID=3239420 RepID=UPI0034E1E1B4
MRTARFFIAPVTAAALALSLGACGSGGGEGDDTTITVAYQRFGNFTQAHELFTDVAADFEEANPGMTVELVPIEAQQNDYFTRLALMNRSPSTAPDVMYEDTYMIRSDVEAGYLAPLDDYLAEWDEWGQFVESAQQAGAGDDGQIYGVSMGTDTRGLWFNRDVLANAGLPADWAPTSWDDLLEAARAIQASDPDVVPFNIYSGTPQGEAAVMQGFEMLLYGTGDTLYEDGQWVVGSQGFIDALDFIGTVYSEGLAPTPQQALDTNIGNTVQGQWLPEGRVGIALDGSWIAGNWLESGVAPWPEWTETMGTAAMPTQDGAAPGAVSMSGGWTLAMGSGSENPDAAFEFISMALNRENSLWFDVAASQIAVRTDVAEDPEYTATNPTTQFFTDLVDVTHFRPATSDYPQISNEIMVAMESVMTGQQTAEEAAAVYDEAVVGIVGEENTTQG